MTYALLGSLAAPFVLTIPSQAEASVFAEKADDSFVLAMGEKQTAPELPPPLAPEEHMQRAMPPGTPVGDYDNDLEITPEVAKRFNLKLPHMGGGHDHDHTQELLNSLPVSEVLLLRAKAEGGDGAAQGALAELYHEGRGLKRDLRSAFYWFRQGAANGDMLSMYYLGRYYRGEFPELKIAKNYDEAERWLLPVAASGDPSAMAVLGTLLFERARNGEPERREEAHWWYNQGTGGSWDPNYVPPSLRTAEASTQGQVKTPDGQQEEAPVLDMPLMPQAAEATEKTATETE